MIAQPSIEPGRAAEPVWSEPLGLWLYGNAALLSGPLGCAPSSLGPRAPDRRLLEAIDEEAERVVFGVGALVCGCHNDLHRRASLVPLRWGAPRVMVFSGGFRFHLGPDLGREPFALASLFRYVWDSRTDLAVSLRSPDKKPTYAAHNPTVDRLILRLVERRF